MERDIFDTYDNENAKKVIHGLECCSFDPDVFPLCNRCPYSFCGEKCENNQTGIRCCDELKADILKLLKRLGE